MQERTSSWDNIAAVKSRLAYLQSLKEAKHLERKEYGTTPSGPISENFSKYYNFRKSSSKVLETQYLLDQLKPFEFPARLLDTGRGFLNCTYAAIQYIWYGLGLAPGIDASLPEECRSVSTSPNEAFIYLGKVNPGLGSYIQNNGGLNFFNARPVHLPDIEYFELPRNRNHLKRVNRLLGQI